MRGIRKIYFYYTFNRSNLIILGISILVMLLMFNMFDFDINQMDYMINYEEYHISYIRESLSMMIPISIVVIMLVMSIDYMTNHKRFDLLFAAKMKSEDILRVKIYVYATLTFIYISLLYLLMIFVGITRFDYFRFDLSMLKLYIALILQGEVGMLIISIAMRIFRAGYSAIIALILYFMSMIICDYNKVIANIIYINIDNGAPSTGLFLPIIIGVLYLSILYFVFGKKELK